jgi:hypothetical protein
MKGVTSASESLLLQLAEVAFHKLKFMNAIHISTAQAMMLRPDPVDLVVFKSDGSLVHYPNVISLKFDFYKGTRTIKFLRSNEIRTVRDVCISKINGLEVFL